MWRLEPWPFLACAPSLKDQRTSPCDGRRAFSYFPRNLEAQPNLFLFHGVVIMGVSPLCREAALRAYCAVARSETLRRLALPQRVARTLLSLGTAAFFSVLVLAFSFPFTRLLKLIY